MTIKQQKYFFELIKLLGYDNEEAKNRAKVKYQVEHFNQISTRDIGELIQILEKQAKEQGVTLVKPEPKPELPRQQQALSEPKGDFPNEFRVWDKKENQMAYVTSTDFEAGSEYFTDEKFHLMQFTGRLDKDGKKIFDFDFVKAFTGKIYLIQWSWKDCAWVAYPEDTNDSFYLSSLGELTIIGNVYTEINK